MFTCSIGFLVELNEAFYLQLLIQVSNRCALAVSLKADCTNAWAVTPQHFRNHCLSVGPAVKCGSADLRIFKRVKCGWFYGFFCGRGRCCCCCFLLSVQSELNFIAEHRAELEIGFLYKMLDSLEITVLWNRSIYSSLYLWLCDTWLWLTELRIHDLARL